MRRKRRTGGHAIGLGRLHLSLGYRQDGAAQHLGRIGALDEAQYRHRGGEPVDLEILAPAEHQTAAV